MGTREAVVGGMVVEGLTELEDRKPKPRPKPRANPITKTQEITMMMIHVFESMRFFMHEANYF